jgi:hypothetical protein
MIKLVLISIFLLFVVSFGILLIFIWIAPEYIEKEDGTMVPVPSRKKSIKNQYSYSLSSIFDQ